MAEKNPYDQFDEPQANPYDQFDEPTAQANPFDQFDQPSQSVAPAASPPRVQTTSPSVALPAPDPWAGVDVSALQRNIGGGVPAKPAPDNRPLLDQAVEAFKNAPREAPKGGNPLTDLPGEYAKDVQQSTDTLTTGLKRMGGSEPISSGMAQGALETALGGLGYVMSPITAAATALVGNPVERTTGIPAAYGDTVALTVTPGVGLTPLTKSAPKAPKVKLAQKAEPFVAEADAPPPGGQPPPPPGGQPPRGTPLTQAPAARNVPVAGEYKGAVEAAAKTVEKIFSPSTVDESSRAAANSFRQELGVAAREDAIAAETLKKVRDSIDVADQPTRNAFINYIETRSTGAANPFPETQPLADAWRRIANKIETDVAQVKRLDGMNFIEDYFPHMWKDQAKAQAWLATTRQGSGRFTKKRTLQLYADGLAAGLEPKYANPVDAMEAYFVNANKFLAHERIFQAGKKAGYVKYLTPKVAQRVAAERGLVPLKGRLSRTMGGPVQYQAYAPENFARVYNNMVDKGFEGALGDMTRATRRGANNITALELGLSGFHAFTTANESILGRMSNAVTAASRGRPLTAVSELVKAPVAPVLDTIKGMRLSKEYLAPGTGSPLTQKITDVITRAGGRPAKQDDLYFGSERRGYLRGAPSAFVAAAKGDFKQAFERTAQALKNTAADLGDDLSSGFGPGEKGRRSLPSAGVQALSNAFKVAGNTLDTMMAPLFQVIVPTLKNGAAYRMVENFMKSYPDATDAEILEYTRRAIDSIDNRFGEMVTDNVAYPRMVKEASQIALRSGSYVYGQLARELGGGMADFITLPFRQGGKATPLWTEKMSYLLAMPVQSALLASMAMYMMTGKWPSDFMDTYKPQTGGTTDRGDPERVNMPGMMKELIEPINKGIIDHFKGKLSTAAFTATELATNRDWKNQKIWYSDEERAMHPRGNEFDPAALAVLKHVLTKLLPITVRNLQEGQPPGSKITPLMTTLGFQRASQSASNPERAEKFDRDRVRKEMSQKLREKDRREQWR